MYVLLLFFLQLALLVSMVTSARRGVNVNFQTWIKNVISDMESATVNPDSPVNIVIKVCLIYYNQIVFNQQSDIFIVKGSVSRFDTSYHVSPLFFIVPKPIESELITLIRNFPWKKL